MIYKLDNIPISNYSAFPGKINHLALDGMLDLPKRTGKTEHIWGTSVEPFVQAQDIVLDGRTLTFRVVIKQQNVEAFKSACIACKKLSFDYDSYDVGCDDEITVQEIGATYRVVTVRFWQNNYILKPITLLPSSGGVFRIDNYNASKDFGIYIGRSESLLNTARRIDVDTTEFYTITNYRDAREIKLKCSMKGNDFADLYSKMTQFQSVLMQPGLRVMKINEREFNIYQKSGMSVNVASDNILHFTLKAQVV